MKLTPRGKLLLLMGLFALPIVASILAYNFLDIRPTANYGELLSPPRPITSARFRDLDGAAFSFRDLAGRWILVTADTHACEAACRDKLVALRQVRLALGRNATRVERVLVVEAQAPAAAVLQPFPGMQVVVSDGPAAAERGPPNDRAHIYLVDPHGNVVMRWPWPAETRRMLKDLERLLKASQIG